MHHEGRAILISSSKIPYILRIATSKIRVEMLFWRAVDLILRLRFRLNDTKHGNEYETHLIPPGPRPEQIVHKLLIEGLAIYEKSVELLALATN